MENARRAAFSFFFQSARAVALRRRLSLLSNHQLRSPLQEGAVRLRHSEKLRCFYLDAARTRLEKRARRTATASLPLWARIPRFYSWNNELERAKDAICERPLNLYVCRRGALWLAYHRTQTQSATQWEFLFNPSTDIDSYYSYDTRTRQKCFIRTGYSFQPSIRLNSNKYKYIYIYIYISHLADTFIQSDLQMRTMEAIKSKKKEQQYASAITSPG